MKKLFHGANRTEEVLSVILFILLILFGSAQILFRFVFNFSLAWTEELSRYTFIFLVYIAASLAIKEDRHVRVEAIDMIIPNKLLPFLRTISDVIWLIVSLVVTFYGLDIVKESFQVEQTSPALQLPMSIVYLIIPLTFLLMSIRIIQQIINRHWKQWGGES